MTAMLVITKGTLEEIMNKEISQADYARIMPTQDMLASEQAWTVLNSMYESGKWTDATPASREVRIPMDTLNDPIGLWDY